MEFPIRCFKCGAQGKVASITPGLQCRCGSTDIDLDDTQVTAGKHDIPENMQRGIDDFETPPGEPWPTPDGHPALDTQDYARGTQKAMERHQFNHDNDYRTYPNKHQGKAHGPGTGWNQPRPNALDGWNEYAGPHANPNPLVSEDLVNMPHGKTCPICKGSGYDISDRSVCRECGGSGVYTPMTSAPSAPQVARHPGQTKTPFFGSKKKLDYNTDTFVMTAACPVDNEAMTRLAKDKNGDAWWSCKCGSLANLDAHPEIDPFNAPAGFTADRGFKARKLLTASKADAGKLFRILATIQNNNEVSPREALTIARRTLEIHPER